MNSRGLFVLTKLISICSLASHTLLEFEGGGSQAGSHMYMYMYVHLTQHLLPLQLL